MTEKAFISPRILIIVWLLAATAVAAVARDFGVESFRVLPNDVTAFITPVMDLNDEGCALIKVQGSPDFVFSTPLGIVKREDNVGEIWIYIPKGSKKITIKHPQWGVLRDYSFPVKIESRMTYELRIDEPLKMEDLRGSLPLAVVRDTLVVVQTDTLLVAGPPRSVPLTSIVAATAAYGGGSGAFMGGMMAALMRRHGAYVHFSSDFGKLGSISGVCDANGYIGGTLPYYTGKTRHSSFIATAGAIHRVTGAVNIFEGVGYGRDYTAWQLSGSSGGKYVRNSALSSKGVSVEVGATYSYKRFSACAAISTIGGKEWYGSVGIGIKIGKL